MIPGQAEKDITFNESILLIDQFLNNSVNGLVEELPESLKVGDKFIITKGDRKNQICFLSHESREKEYLIPCENSVIFSRQQKSFFLFYENKWTIVGASQEKIPSNFIGASKEYKISNDSSYHYLYLSDNTTINLDGIELPEIIIIKQNENDPKTLKWSWNILWENQLAHVITQTKNRFDIVKLFRLPESNHFLGKIISQNFKF